MLTPTRSASQPNTTRDRSGSSHTRTSASIRSRQRCQRRGDAPEQLRARRVVWPADLARCHARGDRRAGQLGRRREQAIDRLDERGCVRFGHVGAHPDQDRMIDSIRKGRTGAGTVPLE